MILCVNILIAFYYPYVKHGPACCTYTCMFFFWMDSV